MQFLNAEHRKAFRFAADLCCSQDRRWLATAYIITASPRLYFDAEPFMCDCYINFARIQFSPSTPTEAALYNAAIDIWNILSPQRCEKQSAMLYSELTPRKWDWPIRTRLAIRPKKEIFRVLLPRGMLRKLIQCQRKFCLRMKTRRTCRLSQ